MSMTRKEAIQYLQPIADSCHLKSYKEALTLALDALKEKDDTLAPVIERVTQLYTVAKGAEKAVLLEVLELLRDAK